MDINIKNIDGFRFICNKILPLVYDDSLSYYEFLCKVMQKLNEVISAVDLQNATLLDFNNAISTFMDALVSEYDETKTYTIGDYCNKGNEVYKCTVTINTPEKWNATHWSKVIFANDFENRQKNFENIINTIINTFMNALVDAYSNSKTYAINDYCQYNNSVYKCVTNISTPEQWTASHWTKVIFASDLKSQWDDFFEHYLKTLGVVQTSGTSITDVMSQSATTVALNTCYANFTSEHNDIEFSSLLTWTNVAVQYGTEVASETRVSTDYFYGNANTLVECTEGYKIAFTKFNFDKTYVEVAEYLDQTFNKFVYLDGDGLYRITLAKSDNSNISTSDVAGHVTITQINMDKTQPPNFGKDYIGNLTFVLGNYSHDKIYSSNTRCVTQYLRLPAYTKIYSESGAKFYLYIFKNGCTRVVSSTSGWVTEWYLTEDTVCHIVLSTNDDAEITNINTLQRKLHAVYLGNNYFTNTPYPIKVKTVPCDIQGTISSGIHYTHDKRIHTDYIKCEKGMYLSVDGYRCSLQFYNAENENSYYKQIFWLPLHYYLITENCYIRVVCSKFDDTTINANDANVEVGWCGKNAHDNVCPKINRNFTVVSHRGLHTTHYQNTLNAFKASITAGYKYIETDVRWSSDNVPICAHDATELGVTIATSTATQCKNAGLCLIEDFLKLCKLNNITPILEPKTNMTSAQGNILHNMINDIGMLNTIMSGFNSVSILIMLTHYNYDVLIAHDYGATITPALFENLIALYSNNNNVYAGFFINDYNDNIYAIAKQANCKLTFYDANIAGSFYNWSEHSDMLYTDTVTPPFIN